MNNPFSRTLRAVESDSARGYLLAAGVGVGALVGILIWMFAGHVDLYASSQHGSFVAEDYAHAIAPQVSGTLVLSHSRLAATVHSGDILFELDAQPQARELAEEQTRRDLSANLVVAVSAELQAQKRARGAAADSVAASLAASRARVEVARTTSSFSTQRQKMLRDLNDQQLLNKLDSLQGERDESVNRGELITQRSEERLSAANGAMSMLDRDVQIAQLEHEVVSAEGAVQTSDARIAEFQYEIERRHVRAAISGVIADLAVIAPGATVQAGQQLGSIVPDQAVHVIAGFDPMDVVGRVKPGQAVVIRVDQYPWTQYGVLDGRVRSVGLEPRDNLIRVDIDVTRPNPAIPITHGLTGVAEIKLEKLRPMDLLLRLAGQQLARTN